MLVRGHQVVFEECIKNTNAGHMPTRVSDDIGHRLWLQGPLNHLGGERRANYIIGVLVAFLSFCMCEPFSCWNLSHLLVFFFFIS
jgi:hypothetical protein